MKHITFHIGVNNPGDLHLIPQVFLKEGIVTKFALYNCHNIFTSNSKPYLYGFNSKSICIRCQYDIKH